MLPLQANFISFFDVDIIRIVLKWFSEHLLWFCIAAFAWLCFSCEEFCEELNRSAIVVNFIDSSQNTPITGIGISIFSIENDSMWYRNQRISQALLPVNPAADSMSFEITLGDNPPDTIIIRYTRHTGFISPECGCVSFAEIQGEPKITKNTIKYTEVTSMRSRTVTYRQGIQNEENIRFYY